MCDTLAIVTGQGVLFAKNSDRDPNEGQNLEWHPRRRSSPGAKLKCTYIEIPDVEETYAVLISRPFWMWGAEIGTNEFGVTIGNEAVFTNQPYARTGLLGMDLLRLALERARTAAEACDVIETLTGEFGQGGGCGHEHRNFTYHNSYIVADRESAFVLETAGGHCAREAVNGPRTISNCLTIPKFSQQYSDFVKTKGSGGRTRQKRTQCLAESVSTVEGLFKILRDHGEGRSGPHYNMLNGGLTAPCVHAGGLAANSQTTASWVAELTPEGCRHWVTGTSSPCTSLFKPVSVDQPLDLGPKAEDTANDSLWWRHEAFHRRVVRNPDSYAAIYEAERDATEANWLAEPPSSTAAFARGDDLLARWTTGAKNLGANDIRPVWARRYWSLRNSRAGMAI